MVKKTLNLLGEFSIPLIAGVVVALAVANINFEGYEHFLDYSILGEGVKLFGHEITFHFLINDIFMVFFFGIAAVEITQSILPGGSLNPVSRAINPLMGTFGGVLGPVAAYFLFCHLFQVDSSVYAGWGIPTATDIALAWLVARLVFGSKHPAVAFLLLLAIADDAIGLGIIAIFYPDPRFPVEIQYMALTLAGMGISFAFRKMKVKSFWPYILFGGTLSWTGLIMSHLHPALALVFIIPFLPHGPGVYKELFAEEEGKHTPLEQYEHSFKHLVDVGLFGFGLANAGVPFSGIGDVTWIVFLSLLIGKTVGIFSFSFIAAKSGMPLPNGMNFKTLFVAGIIAALGLTVALFVAGEAFQDATIQGAAKMGALFSVVAAAVAIVAGKIIQIKKIN